MKGGKSLNSADSTLFRLVSRLAEVQDAGITHAFLSSLRMPLCRGESHDHSLLTFNSVVLLL